MLAETLIRKVEWSAYSCIDGAAEGIGVALLELVSSDSSAASGAAYWKLENHVVVQGAVYDAGVPTVSVLVAALAEPRPAFVQITALELMFQLLAGHPAPGGPPDLVAQCRGAAQEGLWVLVGLLSTLEDATREVLAFLDTSSLHGAFADPVSSSA